MLFRPIRQHLLEIFPVVLRNFEIPGQSSLAGGILPREQVALPALPPHDLAGARRFEALCGAPIGLEFHLCHGTFPFQNSSLNPDIY